jgi:hypothetical protein
MRGDATVFTRRDEAEGEWRIITPIEEARARLPAPRFRAARDQPRGMNCSNSGRYCRTSDQLWGGGVPQPSAFQKLERHFLEFSGDIGSYSFLPGFWRAPDMGLTVAQIFAQKQAYAAQ